ncbi:hypothetical protein PoB_003126200 [Plakobranchus ocellatus]|uniref:Uncharacterized protein n=1 Tax=Plakobranchus ocellatus TaxID=259542 RepID=A0AAV4ACJ1_9GAST|nr:hypothetical protein PoB_003126200 [Plakobranchus ocellatus]
MLWDLWLARKRSVVNKYHPYSLFCTTTVKLVLSQRADGLPQRCNTQADTSDAFTSQRSHPAWFTFASEKLECSKHASDDQIGHCN